MKGLTVLFAGILLTASTVAAQDTQAPARTARADVTGSIGWLNLRHAQDNRFQDPNNWLNDILYGGAAGGWYVTDHVKTELELFSTSRGRQYRTRELLIEGAPTWGSSEFRVRDTGVAASLQYQFLHNVWAQPYVAAGIEIAHETTSDEGRPIFITDPVTHALREVVPARTDTAAHWDTRPFVAFGGKSYAARQVFLFGDVRLAFRGGIDRALFRGGIGMEF